jgi:hypothetical protein
LRRTKNGCWGLKLNDALKSHAQHSNRICGSHREADSETASGRWQVTDAETSYYAPQWRISDELVKVIPELLERCRPQTILETGPGLSSIIFYKYQSECPNVKYFNIDQRGPTNHRFRAHISSLGFDVKNSFACDLPRRLLRLVADRDQS